MLNRCFIVWVFQNKSSRLSSNLCRPELSPVPHHDSLPFWKRRPIRQPSSWDLGLSEHRQYFAVTAISRSPGRVREHRAENVTQSARVRRARFPDRAPIRHIAEMVITLSEVACHAAPASRTQQETRSIRMATTDHHGSSPAFTGYGSQDCSQRRAKTRAHGFLITPQRSWEPRHQRARKKGQRAVDPAIIGMLRWPSQARLQRCRRERPAIEHRRAAVIGGVRKILPRFRAAACPSDERLLETHLLHHFLARLLSSSCGVIWRRTRSRQSPYETIRQPSARPPTETLTPPADSPKIVTFPGSPPKALGCAPYPLQRRDLIQHSVITRAVLRFSRQLRKREPGEDVQTVKVITTTPCSARRVPL